MIVLKRARCSQLLRKFAWTMSITNNVAEREVIRICKELLRIQVYQRVGSALSITEFKKNGKNACR